MPVHRLPESTLALATELRDLALRLEGERSLLLPGTPTVKTVARRRYWYLQNRGGGIESQRSMGPETPELLARIDQDRRLRERLAPELETLRRLNDMVVAGGALAESAAATRVVEILADAGLFRAGAVLVGTRAFVAYGTLLGFRPSAAARTQDFDVAVGPVTALALPRDERGRLPELLAATDPPFLAVPELDRGQPSTSFKLRGRELRVDFLTPLRGRESERPVELPGLGVAATPLRLLDELMEKSIAAVLTGTRPVVVQVPDPARFALHKLWLASQRGTTEAARARKDRAQASDLLEILADDRPADLDRAAVAFARRPRVLASIRKQTARLDRRIAERLAATLEG